MESPIKHYSQIITSWLLRGMLAIALNSCIFGAVTVRTVGELKDAIDRANSDSKAESTILIEDGNYHLKWPKLTILRPGMTVAGRSGRREAVVLTGEHGMMGGRIEFIFEVDADDVTIRDLTMENVGSHAVIVHGEAPYDADRTTLRNLVIRDTFQQMVKVTPGNANPDAFFSENGVLEDSLLEYSAGIGPQFYIGGIDAHGAKDWIVRRNVFRNIISPSRSLAEHAVHFWSWSRGTLVENNLIINCDRGIGLGLSNSGHTGGTIRNNIIFHDERNPGGFADVSIEVLHCDGAMIYNNTVWQAHTNYFSGIKNFESKNVTIANNAVLMHPHSYWKLQQAIWVKDGTGPVLSNALSAPMTNWFVSVTPKRFERIADAASFLHIRDASVEQLVAKGTSDIPGFPKEFIDFDGSRPASGRPIDIGARQLHYR